MSTGSQKRTRLQRVASLELPPGRFARLVHHLRRRDVLGRLGLCLLAAMAIWAISAGWQPPFSPRVGYTPQHDFRARVEFEEPNPRVPEGVILYEVGHVLAEAHYPLTAEDVRVLELEHAAYLASLTSKQRWTLSVHRSLAWFGKLFALFAACGYYLHLRQPKLLQSPARLAAILLLVCAGVTVAKGFAVDPWRADVLPPLLFGMTIAIAYSQETAMLLTAAFSVVLILATGGTLGDLLVMLGSVATAVLFTGRIRSRSKLIKVGLLTAAAAALLTIVVGVLEHQPIAAPLLTLAARNLFWGLAAGFLMTGLLPFIERLFGVLTEISLLELGDVAHPLLQELVRRAPGTYNHSINVASLAESAADAIGANGLLTRVGAYFHDIGKMFKPGYFIENVGQDVNRHESLVPAMSTLIIIAHVKDGADLARQHHLPQPIIDFIEQHHGTTLVEFFFRRASQLNEANPDGGQVEENSFRYPGPKPQTKESGVLMLADAVESACRVLVEPTPARIEGLVHDLMMKRLLDGQFDESGLNLLELRTIQESLVKSLTAVYHGRVKYPDQRTA